MAPPVKAFLFLLETFQRWWSSYFNAVSEEKKSLLEVKMDVFKQQLVRTLSGGFL